MLAGQQGILPDRTEATQQVLAHLSGLSEGTYELIVSSNIASSTTYGCLHCTSLIDSESFSSSSIRYTVRVRGFSIVGAGPAANATVTTLAAEAAAAETDDVSSNTGAILGAVLGSLLGVVLVITIVSYVCTRVSADAHVFVSK
jgi:hypothetical protein